MCCLKGSAKRSIGFGELRFSPRQKVSPFGDVDLTNFRRAHLVPVLSDLGV